MSPKSASDPILDAILQLDLPLGSRVLLAVSGGADSTALLRAVVHSSQLEGRAWTVAVGHVNHGLRGTAAKEDEEFVHRAAAELGLECFSRTLDTADYARAHHLSVEAAARELRYGALSEMLRGWNGDVVMTGHTQDDQAETVMLRLLRGAGLRGLAGMPVRYGTVVRPFLRVGRHEVIAYLQSIGQGYRVDATNLDTRHLRNRVRREVMPTLSRLQPQLVPVLARTAELLRTDSDFVFEQAADALWSLDFHQGEGWVSASAAAWRSLHPALQYATLLLALDRLLGPAAGVTREHVARLAGLLSGDRSRPSAPLPRGVRVEMSGERFVLSVQAVETPAPPDPARVDVSGSTAYAGGTLRAEILQPDEANLERYLAVCGPLHALIALGTVSADMTIGPRAPGERMHPLGSPGSRKVQDILVDHKVPRDQRDGIPVIRDAAGIVWIIGVALDERRAARGGDSPILHLYWTPELRR